MNTYGRRVEIDRKRRATIYTGAYDLEYMMAVFVIQNETILLNDRPMKRIKSPHNKLYFFTNFRDG